jgi:hypothetical protein
LRSLLVSLSLTSPVAATRWPQITHNPSCFGQYEITFQNGYFPGGRAAMTVGSAGTQEWHPFIASVTQHDCGTFHITLWYANQGFTTDHRFQFVATGEHSKKRCTWTESPLPFDRF